MSSKEANAAQRVLDEAIERLEALRRQVCLGSVFHAEDQFQAGKHLANDTRLIMAICNEAARDMADLAAREAGYQISDAERATMLQADDLKEDVLWCIEQHADAELADIEMEWGYA